jgi:cold shock CspA family protein
VANIRSKGTLTKWLDDKGFGFITPEKGKQEIFVHISAFDKALPRRPKAGDTIFYYPQKDEKGKTKAVDAIIEGVAPVARTAPPKSNSYRRESRSRSSWKLLVLCTILIIAGGFTIYDKFGPNIKRLLPNISQTSNAAFKPSPSATQSSRYTCAGKTHCSHMRSCEEATFYLQNCPGTKMDGDGDGIPCERQLCN